MGGERLTRFRKLNDEVLYPTETIVQVNRQDIDALVSQAQANVRKRIRICADPDPGDRLHEMLIVHTCDTYVRPHKHLDNTESFRIIEVLVRPHVGVAGVDDEHFVEPVAGVRVAAQMRIRFRTLACACETKASISCRFT